MKLKLLHIADEKPHVVVWPGVFRSALADVGDLTLVENGRAMDEAQRLALIQGCEVLFLGWGAAPVPAAVAHNPGALRYICSITGTIRKLVCPEIVASGLLVTNWGDAPAAPVAEGAMALLLAVLKDMHLRTQTVRRDGWRLDSAHTGGSLEGLNVGIYGCGAIGRRFIELIRPFQPVLRVFDPYMTDTPAGCERVASLEALFDASQAVVIHAGLTPETLRSVTAGLLARLPRHGIVINTARGGIVDQDALFAELAAGRLRAGLDVLDPDSLPPGHPARNWENCILTCHEVHHGWPTDGKPPTRLEAMHRICLDNLRRFAAGQPLRFVVDPVAYRRQT